MEIIIMKKKKAKLMLSEFLDEMKQLEEEASLDKIKKLRERVDFSDPDETINVGDRTFLLLSLENSDTTNNTLGILHLLDEFEIRNKVKIISYFFDQRYFDEYKREKEEKELINKYGQSALPLRNEPLRKLFNGIWLSHIPAM